MTEKNQLSRASKLDLEKSILRIWRKTLLMQLSITIGAMALMILFFSDAGIAFIVILGFILCIMPVRSLVKVVGIRREIRSLEAG